MFIVNHEGLLFDPIGVVPCVYTIYYKHIIPSGLGFCLANLTPPQLILHTIISCVLCSTFAPFAVNHATIVEQILRYTTNDIIYNKLLFIQLHFFMSGLQPSYHIIQL